MDFSIQKRTLVFIVAIIIAVCFSSISHAQTQTSDSFITYEEQGQRFGVVKQDTLWEKPSGIYVCWESVDPEWTNERDLVKNSIHETWERYSKVRFLGWEHCVLIPEQAAHLFRDDAAHPFRLIVARHSD
jgi:hypothetical protein